MIYLGQSDSGSVGYLKAGPLSLFEFALNYLTLYVRVCLFKSIELKNKLKALTLTLNPNPNPSP